MMLPLKKLLRIELAHPIQSWRALKDLDEEDLPSLIPMRKRPSIQDRAATTPQPSIYSLTRPPHWRGPRYLRIKSWREDLLAVTEQLAALVRANAPLVQGLEAAGLESIRLRRERKSVGGTAVTVVLPVLVIFLSLSAPLFTSTPHIPSLFVLFGLQCCFIGYTLCSAQRMGLSRETVFLVMSQRMKQGMTLSEAMRSMPRFFPRLYADLVETGESCGQVAACLDELNEDTVNTLHAQNVLRNNLGYLACVFAVQSLMVAFMSVKVVPIFQSVYAEFGGPLPMSTQALMHLSDWLVYNWYMLLISIALIGFSLFLLYKFIARGRSAMAGPLGTLLMFLPWFRGLIVKQNLAMAALIIEKLLHGGATLDQALDSTANAALLPAYQRKFARIRTRILQGESLSEACGAHTGLPALPAAFRGFVTLGENAGMMPAAIARIGRIYRRDAEQGMRIFSDAFLPFAVVALGSGTLFVLLGLYLPIFNLIDVLLSQM